MSNINSIVIRNNIDYISNIVANQNSIITTPNIMNEFILHYSKLSHKYAEVGMYEDGSEIFYVLFSENKDENDMEFSNIDALKTYICSSSIFNIKWVSENDPFEAEWIEWDVNTENELVGRILGADIENQLAGKINALASEIIRTT